MNPYLEILLGCEGQGEDADLSVSYKYIITQVYKSQVDI